MYKRFTAALIALALPIVFAHSAMAAEYNLKMQTYYSASTATGAKFFADQVKKMTGGRVEIQVFTGGELVGSANILKSVRSGMIDIGQGMGHHFTERKSGLMESGLPMSWMSATEASILYDQRGLGKLVAEEYDKLGVTYLGPTWAAPFTTLSKKPIRSLDDMRKMKIRAAGATAKMLTALGINCVTLPPEDIYMALTTGQIDGVVYGSAAEYKETKYYEAASWLNVTPIIDPITDTLIINTKLWKKFPEDIRAAIQAAADTTRWVYYIWGESESLKVIEEIFKDKTTSFSEEDQKEMAKAAATIWDQEAKKSPDCQKAVDMLKQFASEKGRM